jgi:hypothetical protein
MDPLQSFQSVDALISYVSSSRSPEKAVRYLPISQGTRKYTPEEVDGQTESWLVAIPRDLLKYIVICDPAMTLREFVIVTGSCRAFLPLRAQVPFSVTLSVHFQPKDLFTAMLQRAVDQSNEKLTSETKRSFAELMTLSRIPEESDEVMYNGETQTQKNALQERVNTLRLQKKMVDALKRQCQIKAFETGIYTPEKSDS